MGKTETEIIAASAPAEGSPREEVYINEKDVPVTDHHYESKVPNMAGVSELPLYPVERREGDAASLKEEIEEVEDLDLFAPFPIDPTHAVEDHILTFRALITGIALGSLVNASNVYLGKSLESWISHSMVLTSPQVSRLVSPSAPACLVPSSATVL